MKDVFAGLAIGLIISGAALIAYKTGHDDGYHDASVAAWEMHQHTSWWFTMPSTKL